MRDHATPRLVIVMLLVLGQQATGQTARLSTGGERPIRPLSAPCSDIPASRSLPYAVRDLRCTSYGIQVAARKDLIAIADTTVKRNRRLGAVIGGAIGLVVGGIIGYQKGDPRVAFDQAYGAAICGGVGTLVGGVIGAVFGPRVP